MGFPVTNSLLLSTIVVAVLAGSALFLRSKLALIPGMLQNVFEIVIEGMLGIMDTILGDRRTSEKYLPLVGTVFLFILFSNWFGLLPGTGSIGFTEGHEFVPFLRSPGSDINFTLALALIAVVAVNILAISVLGIRKHLSKFLNFKNPMYFFVGILEFISEFARVISFAFRLFGNVFAGEVLLVIVAFLVPYIVPMPFMFLEIFVGFIQAFVFGMLTLVFIAISTAEVEAH